MKQESDTDYRLTWGICMGLCFGSLAGIVIWSITDKIFWMPVLSALGLSLGIAISMLIKPGEGD